jgi:hypothetical protein
MRNFERRTSNSERRISYSVAMCGVTARCRKDRVAEEISSPRPSGERARERGDLEYVCNFSAPSDSRTKRLLSLALSSSQAGGEDDHIASRFGPASFLQSCVRPVQRSTFQSSMLF